MKNTNVFFLLLFIVGLFVGAMSWGVVSLVSNRFEPFDSSLGFFIGQSMLSVVALGIGYQFKIRQLFAFIASAYVGMNLYAYLFGGSEARAWIFLGLITTLSLIVIPGLFGFLGRLLKFLFSKFRKGHDPTPHQGASGDAKQRRPWASSLYEYIGTKLARACRPC